MDSNKNVKDHDGTYSMKQEISQFLDKVDSDFSVYPGAERSEYDFVSERNSLYTMNILEATGHMIKSVLGAGILSMHEAYMYGGIWTSLAATAVIVLIAPYNTLMLVRLAQLTYHRLRMPKMSYADLMEVAVAAGPECLRKFRKIFRYTVDLFLFVELCSSCNIYQIMMAKTLKHALEAVSDDISALQLHIRLYILMVTVPLILLCIIKSLKFTAIMSILADIVIGFCICVTLAFAMDKKPNISERAAWKSVHGLFRFSGILIYSIDCITPALPIENNMKKPIYFPVVVWLAMPIAIVACSAVGFFGYWKWGETCISPIIMHLPMNVGNLIIYFMFIVVLAVTFAVNFWLPFKIFWVYGKKRITRKRFLWETLFRLVLVLIISIFSVSFPNIINIMSLIGNVFLGFITFIFPAIIYCLITYKDQPPIWRRLLNMMSLMLGLTVVGGGLYSAIKQ